MKKRNKEIVLLEAYYYEYDCMVARLVMHIADEGLGHFYEVERYFEPATMSILDADYYNPYERIVRKDFDMAVESLQQMAREFIHEWGHGEVDVR